MRLLNLVKPIMFTFAIFLGISSHAQEPVNCRAEVDKICSPTQAGGKGAVLKCLSENQENIPVVCKLEIERFIRAAQQTQDQSEGALATIGGLNAPNPPFPTLALESSYFGGDYSLSNSRLNLTSPFAGGETETWTASLAGGHVAIGSNPVLSNGDLIPKTLDRVEVALQYEKKLPGYRRWSVKGSVGSSGDELFKSGKDSLLSLNLQYGYPSKGGGFWTYFLFLSNNSPFGSFVPIPGVLYVIRTPTFTGLFGIPIVSLQWSMTPRSTLSFSQTGLAMTAEVSYGNKTNIEGFAAFNWANQSFILHDRLATDDRFTIEDKRLAGGVRVFALARAIVEAQGGYAFDRLLYSGKGMRNFRRGKFEADDGAFVLLSLKSRL